SLTALYGTTKSMVWTHTVSAQSATAFTAAVNDLAGVAPTAVAVGDFNGDTIADLAVANLSSNNVSVLLGGGAGAFGTSVDYNVGSSPEAIAVGDFNGDGKTDLAV